MQPANARSPVIDGHVDLPILVREFYGNDLSKFDLKKETVSSLLLRASRHIVASSGRYRGISGEGVLTISAGTSISLESVKVTSAVSSGPCESVPALPADRQLHRLQRARQ